MSKVIQNAKITSVYLGGWDESVPEYNGMITAFIQLDYGGSGQGFGGRALRGAFTHEFITGVLNALEVSSWEKLVGLSVRVEGDFGKVYRIGHYLKDSWFDPTKWDEEKDDRPN